MFCHIPLVVVGVGDVDGQVEVAHLQVSAHGGEALLGKVVQNLIGADTVFGQFVLVQADAYLFVFQSVGSQVRDGINAAQSVFQLVYVCIQFPIGFLLAFHRNEQGRGIGDVIHSLQGKNTRRKGALEGLQAMLELAPEGIPVLHVAVEFQEHDQYAVLALGIGLFLVHLLVSEDEVFQRFSHPFFHLFGCSARIYGYAGTLPDGELRHLLLGHDADAEYA